MAPWANTDTPRGLPGQIDQTNQWLFPVTGGTWPQHPVRWTEDCHVSSPHVVPQMRSKPWVTGCPERGGVRTELISTFHSPGVDNSLSEPASTKRAGLSGKFFSEHEIWLKLLQCRSSTGLKHQGWDSSFCTNELCGLRQVPVPLNLWPHVARSDSCRIEPLKESWH